MTEPFLLEARIQPKQTEGFEGREWDVVIIGANSPDDIITIGKRQFIRSKNGRLYDIEALKASTPLWEGVKVYDNHLTQEEFEKKQGMRSVAREWIGSIINPHWKAAAKQLTGTLKIVEEALAKKLKAAWDADILNTIGLSIDTLPVYGQEAIVEGKATSVVEGFKKIFSLDLVAEPAAGGGFNRLIAAQLQTQKGDNAMDEDKVKELIASAISDALPKAVADALAAQQQQQEAEQQEPPPEEETPEQEVDEQDEPEQEDPEQPEETVPESLTREEFERYKRELECRHMLTVRLSESKLPDEIKEIGQEMFKGRIFEIKELDRWLEQMKKAQAALDPSGRVAEAGNGRITAGMNEQDWQETEFLRLVMGDTSFRGLEKQEEDFVTERIPEAYNAWTKAGRRRGNYRRISEWTYDILGGNYFTDERAMEAATTSSMSSIVKNALNVMLAANYARRQRWWEPIVTTEEVETIDQATLVRVYGMDTLDVVTEGAPYTELDWADEEETASFVKKGNYVGVTMETLLRDKVQAVRTIPQRLATSWFNTLSALVSGVFTVNSNTGPVLGTTGALFNSTAVSSTGGHANLTTSGLSWTTYDAGYTSMTKQTDQTSGNGQRLLITPKYLLVPTDLRATAYQIRNTEHKPGSSNFQQNPYGPNGDQPEIMMVPTWTDTDNWALVADPMMFPAIWLIFLRGQRVPQLFTADSETSGAMFTNDTIRYKVRMLTWRFSSSYDCAPVSDFRPLYKGNV